MAAAQTRAAVSAELSETTGFADRVAGAVTNGLVIAPVGSAPLIEAAYAWHKLRTPRIRGPRPLHDSASPRPRPRVPVVETDVEGVAVRLAQLLSCLTWATVRRVDPPTEPPQPSLVYVDVPAELYHRVHKSLTAAWRDAATLWDRPTQTRGRARQMSKEDQHGAAVGLWRMAMLLYGIGPHRGAVTCRVGTETEAGLLGRAGEYLGVLPSVDRVRGGFVVVLCSPNQVLRLLREAGAGDAAYAWAKVRPQASLAQDLGS